MDFVTRLQQLARSRIRQLHPRCRNPDPKHEGSHLHRRVLGVVMLVILKMTGKAEEQPTTCFHHLFLRLHSSHHFKSAPFAFLAPHCSSSEASILTKRQDQSRPARRWEDVAPRLLNTRASVIGAPSPKPPFLHCMEAGERGRDLCNDGSSILRSVGRSTKSCPSPPELTNSREGGVGNRPTLTSWRRLQRNAKPGVDRKVPTRELAARCSNARDESCA